MQDMRQDIEKLLQEGKSLQIKPQGYSMYPVLVPGRDEAVIEPVDPSRLKRADVVLYRRDSHVGGILVLHRIWKATKEGVFLVGDNQWEIEGPLRKDQIKGIMVGIVRNGSFFSVKHPLYRFLTGGWLLLRPFRPVITRTAAAGKRLAKKVFKGREQKEK